MSRYNQMHVLVMQFVSSVTLEILFVTQVFVQSSYCASWIPKMSILWIHVHFFVSSNCQFNLYRSYITLFV
jgi:hypothetical protein